MVARPAYSPRRFDIFLAVLDPSVGSEIRKTRPCVVISPDEANEFIDTVIIAPMTTGAYAYPTRIPILFKGKAGHVVLDQLRTVDKTRLVKRLGTVDDKTSRLLCLTLQEMFAF